jgi:hypothetical protein
MLTKTNKIYIQVACFLVVFVDILESLLDGIGDRRILYIVGHLLPPVSQALQCRYCLPCSRVFCGGESLLGGSRLLQDLMNESEVSPVTPAELEIIVRLVAKIQHLFAFVSKIGEMVDSLVKI